MDKLGDLIRIKILISGKTQSFSIDCSRAIKLSELSRLVCQKFNYRIEEIKIILNNKPIEKYKDQCLATAISKDKKPYLIIYFNENETNLNKSVDSKGSIKTKNYNSTSQIYQPVLNKARNISPRELERKKFIFNKEIENIDSELKKFNQVSININDCVYFNNEKNAEINNIPHLIQEYEKDFSKIIEKVEKIKDLIFKSVIQKQEHFNNYKIHNQQKMLILKQKVEIFNKNLSKLNKLYSDIFEDFDLETFDELNNVQISSNIYKILESVYERKKEYDEIKSNLNEINSSYCEVPYDPQTLIANINEKLNTIYLDISSSMNSKKQESIHEISTIRVENSDMKPSNKNEDQTKVPQGSNFKRELIYENLPDFNTLNNNNKRNSNENNYFDQNLLSNFNTIKSNNKNTLNLNDESNPNIASKLLSSYKKQESLENENIQGEHFKKSAGRKIYINRIELENSNPSIDNNNVLQNHNNNLNNLKLIKSSNDSVINSNQYILKRSLSRENSAKKSKNRNQQVNQYNSQRDADNNFIRNIPSQIIYNYENKPLSDTKISNQATITTNNNIATSNGFHSGYLSNNNDFTEAPESKRLIFKTGNTYSEKLSNPFSGNEDKNQNPVGNPDYKQIEMNVNQTISNNNKNTNLNSKTNTKFIISLRENTNSIFVYNAYSKIKCTYEVNFPLDSKENKFSWNCRLFQKDSDIFITGGHNDNNIPSKRCLYLNTNIFDYYGKNNYSQKNINITELKQMNFSRWAHSLILLGGRFLFCVSGYNNKKCEYLDIQNNKWKNISEVNIWRMDANLFIFNNSFIYVFGGFNDNNKFQKPFVKKIEKLKIFNKGIDVPSSVNKWEFVNIFDHKGESNVNYLIPCMGIITLSENKFLLVGGDTSDYSNIPDENSHRNAIVENMNGNLEDNNFNPNSSNSLNKAGYKLEYHENMFMVKINFLGNCEISQYRHKLNKTCCFTTAKNFLSCADVFYCFDHSLELCEIGSDLLNIQ